MIWLTDAQFRELLKLKCKEYGLRNFCRIHKIQEGGVCNMLRNNKSIGPSVAKALGFKKVVMFVKETE